jgi:hypothetical protein
MAEDHSMLYVLQTALMAFVMYNLLLGLVFVLVTHIERREVEAKVYGMQIMKKKKSTKRVTMLLSRGAILCVNHAFANPSLAHALANLALCF